MVAPAPAKPAAPEPEPATNCANCGKELAPGNPRKKYCSDECRQRAIGRRRYHSQKTRDFRELTCEHCRQTFQGRPSKKFCSDQCRRDAKAAILAEMRESVDQIERGDSWERPSFVRDVEDRAEFLKPPPIGVPAIDEVT